MKSIKMLLALMMLGLGFAHAQQSETNKNEETMKPQILNTYVIEREVPDAGDLTEADLKSISQTSCTVLEEMDQNEIQWMHSYVTENKVFCVYRAKNEDLIRQHAEKGKFPCNSINKLSTKIGPATSN